MHRESVIDHIAAELVPATLGDEEHEARPERWHVNVRRSDRIVEDGTVVASTTHRHVLEPGASLKDEDPLVQTIAKAIWR